MKRYCINDVKIDDILEEDGSFIIRKAPITIYEFVKNYIPSHDISSTRLVEEKVTPLYKVSRKAAELLNMQAEEDSILSDEILMCKVVGDEIEILQNSEIKDYEDADMIYTIHAEKLKTLSRTEIGGIDAISYIDPEMLPMFPECESEIRDFLGTEVREGNIGTEEDMYSDILKSSFSSELVELDIYLHIYYTLLYRGNCEKFIPLKVPSWPEDKKKDMNNRRIEYKKYERKKYRGNNTKAEEEKPFNIIERYSKVVEIQDFAPNIVRLYYMSPKFRNIFKEINDLEGEKYKYSQVIEVFNDEEGEVESRIKLNRKEEIWLCEFLVGINLAISFYSFFNVILKGIAFENIKDEYQEYIRGIIHEIMRIRGTYSRCVMVEKLKIVCELRKKSNLYSNRAKPKMLLDFLYKVILQINMGEFAKQYTQMEQYVINKWREKEKTPGFMERIEQYYTGICSKYLQFSKGYYFINGMPQTVENERLYALIQKIIINEK